MNRKTIAMKQVILPVHYGSGVFEGVTHIVFDKCTVNEINMFFGGKEKKE